MGNISLPIAVHVFLIKNKKILLLKRSGTGFKDGLWSVPAGRLDGNETMFDAAIREAFEEVGVSIDINNLSEPLIMHHRDKRGERIYFFFSTDKWDGAPENKEPEKCSEIKWYDIENLPNTMVEHIPTAIVAHRNKKTFISYGF